MKFQKVKNLMKFLSIGAEDEVSVSRSSCQRHTIPLERTNKVGATVKAPSNHSIETLYGSNQWRWRNRYLLCLWLRSSSRVGSAHLHSYTPTTVAYPLTTVAKISKTCVAKASVLLNDRMVRVEQ